MNAATTTPTIRKNAIISIDGVRWVADDVTRTGATLSLESHTRKDNRMDGFTAVYYTAQMLRQMHSAGRVVVTEAA